MRRNNLRIGNFSRGMIRDSATDEERLLSLRTMKNYFIDYTDGRCKVRKGYTRWNDTALGATARQIFWFGDLSQNEHLLGIIDGSAFTGRWFKIAESGAHTALTTETCTARRPVIQVGNRVFFGTDGDGADIGFRWTDNAGIVAGTSNRVGIARPGTGTYVSTSSAVGHTDTATNLVTMTTTTRRKLAIQYDVGAADLEIDAMYVSVAMEGAAGKAAEVPGAWTCRIFTDNGGEPSTTFVDDSAISDPVNVFTFDLEPDPALKRFLFQDVLTLPANTTVWFELSGDANYYDNFEAVVPVLFDGKVGTEGTAPGHDFGPLLVFDNGASTWGAEPGGREAVFSLSGIDSDKAYGHVLTFYESTYGIESRPSVEDRSTITAGENFAVSTPSSADADKVRIYRRQMDDITDNNAEITDKYKFVGEVDDGDSFTDFKSTENLGAVLQTEDHYRFDETDDGDDAIRAAALLPAVAVYWKSRIWFAEANDNKLYFSKILEQDGATGLTADSIPDFYPLDNKLEFDEVSDIIALVALSADELAVYFRNTSVWILRGADDVLNPPADIVRRRPVTDVGLVAPIGVDSLRSRHVFLARKGVYSFAGTSAIEYLSGGVQTILDEIADTSLDDSVVVTLGDSVWIAVDEDETADGILNNIYILDIQRQPATWRLYSYDVSLYDMVVRKTGTEYKTLLAADAENNFILQLENGNDDNGSAIVAEAETQDLIAPNLSTIFEISIDAFYPNTPPLYEGEVTDGLGETHSFELSPSAINDLAGHKAYPIIASAIGSRVKLTQRTVNQNHLRAFDIGYVEL